MMYVVVIRAKRKRVSGDEEKPNERVEPEEVIARTDISSIVPETTVPVDLGSLLGGYGSDAD